LPLDITVGDPIITYVNNSPGGAIVTISSSTKGINVVQSSTGLIKITTTINVTESTYIKFVFTLTGLDTSDA
jgi:hypothetical protein